MLIERSQIPNPGPEGRDQTATMDLEVKIAAAVLAVLFLAAILRIEIESRKLRRLRARIQA